MSNIKNIILKAGEVLKQQYFRVQTYSTKEKYDLVSDTDYLIERLIIDEITAAYPGYSIYSEEVGSIGNTSDNCWIIDPIDGTANFIFGVPYFCISLCLKSGGAITEAYVCIKRQGMFGRIQKRIMI